MKTLDKNTPKRILALDGGGIRGILTLGYLKHIQTLLRKRHVNEKLVLSDYYDLIGGTSTGAIIATCLVLGYDVDRIIELYRNRIDYSQCMTSLPRWTEMDYSPRASSISL